MFQVLMQTMDIGQHFLTVP